MRDARDDEPEAMASEAKLYPKESTKEFLQRLGAIGGDDEGLNETIDEMQRFIDENRKPHRGIEL